MLRIWRCVGVMPRCFGVTRLLILRLEKQLVAVRFSACDKWHQYKPRSSHRHIGSHRAPSSETHALNSDDMMLRLKDKPQTELR